MTEVENDRKYIMGWLVIYSGVRVARNDFGESTKSVKAGEMVVHSAKVEATFFVWDHGFDYVSHYCHAPWGPFAAFFCILQIAGLETVVGSVVELGIGHGGVETGRYIVRITPCVLPVGTR